VPRVPAPLACLVLTIALAGCGGSGDDQAASPAETAAPDGAPTAPPCEQAPATAEPAAGATTDLSVKPEPQIDGGAPPCDLVVSDIVVGQGEQAVPGVEAEVKYVGALYDDGSEFDSSWSRSPDETLPFEVGSPGLIPGFDQGVQGMREGGRRQVVIPSQLGYGATGQGPIPPAATLVFVIDLVEVTPQP
jgi:FKBP-type peptidyl-prolyl cis-trans isomerase